MSEAFVWPDLKARPENPIAPETMREQAAAEGREQGYAQGLEAGRAAARAEAEALRQELRGAMEQMEQQLASLAERRTEELAGLVHALCRKVLGWELTTSVEVLEEIVAEGMSRLEAEGGEADVYLHPDDHAVIVAGYHGNLPLHADPQVPRCGVSVRLATQAADFDPGGMIDELFEAARRDLTG